MVGQVGFARRAGRGHLHRVIVVHHRFQLAEEERVAREHAADLHVDGLAAVVTDSLDEARVVLPAGHRVVDIDLVRRVLKELPIDIANINSTNQVVVSGDARAMPQAEAQLRESLAEDKPFRFIPLNVSAPFHSRFMSTIVEPFGDTLRTVGKGIDQEKSAVVTSNFRGGFHSGLYEDLINNLVSQLNNSVRWVDNMKSLSARADTIYEIGPGRPLRDFFKTINISCSSITTLSAAERLWGKNA